MGRFDDPEINEILTETLKIARVLEIQKAAKVLLNLSLNGMRKNDMITRFSNDFHSQFLTREQQYDALYRFQLDCYDGPQALSRLQEKYRLKPRSGRLPPVLIPPSSTSSCSPATMATTRESARLAASSSSSSNSASAAAQVAAGGAESAAARFLFSHRDGGGGGSTAAHNSDRHHHHRTPANLYTSTTDNRSGGNGGNGGGSSGSSNSNRFYPLPPYAAPTGGPSPYYRPPLPHVPPHPPRGAARLQSAVVNYSMRNAQQQQQQQKSTNPSNMAATSNQSWRPSGLFNSANNSNTGTRMPNNSFNYQLQQQQLAQQFNQQQFSNACANLYAANSATGFNDTNSSSAMSSMYPSPPPLHVLQQASSSSSSSSASHLHVSNPSYQPPVTGAAARQVYPSYIDAEQALRNSAFRVDCVSFPQTQTLFPVPPNYQAMVKELPRILYARIKHQSRMPFYRNVECLVPPVRLHNIMSVKSAAYLMGFIRFGHQPERLTPPHVSNNNGHTSAPAHTDLMIRFFKIDDVEAQLDTLPPNVTVEVRSSTGSVNTPPQALYRTTLVRFKKSKPKHEKPIIIPAEFAMRERLIDVIVTYTPSESDYEFAVGIFRAQSVSIQEEVDTIMHMPLVPSISRQSILRELKPTTNGDDDIGAAEVSSLPLKCPISKSRIKVPCRALLCTVHHTCDAYSFVEMNYERPTWRCFLCNKDVYLQDLRYESFIAELLNNKFDGVTVPTIAAGGDGVVNFVLNERGDDLKIKEDPLATSSTSSPTKGLSAVKMESKVLTTSNNAVAAGTSSKNDTAAAGSSKKKAAFGASSEAPICLSSDDEEKAKNEEDEPMQIDTHQDLALKTAGKKDARKDDNNLSDDTAAAATSPESSSSSNSSSSSSSSSGSDSEASSSENAAADDAADGSREVTPSATLAGDGVDDDAAAPDWLVQGRKRLQEMVAKKKQAASRSSKRKHRQKHDTAGGSSGSTFRQRILRAHRHQHQRSKRARHDDSGGGGTSKRSAALAATAAPAPPKKPLKTVVDKNGVEIIDLTFSSDEEVVVPPAATAATTSSSSTTAAAAAAAASTSSNRQSPERLPANLDNLQPAAAGAAAVRRNSVNNVTATASSSMTTATLPVTVAGPSLLSAQIHVADAVVDGLVADISNTMSQYAATNRAVAREVQNAMRVYKATRFPPYNNNTATTATTMASYAPASVGASSSSSGGGYGAPNYNSSMIMSPYQAVMVSPSSSSYLNAMPMVPVSPAAATASSPAAAFYQQQTYNPPSVSSAGSSSNNNIAASSPSAVMSPWRQPPTMLPFERYGPPPGVLVAQRPTSLTTAAGFNSSNENVNEAQNTGSNVLLPPPPPPPSFVLQSAAASSSMRSSAAAAAALLSASTNNITLPSYNGTPLSTPAQSHHNSPSVAGTTTTQHSIYNALLAAATPSTTPTPARNNNTIELDSQQRAAEDEFPWYEHQLNDQLFSPLAYDATTPKPAETQEKQQQQASPSGADGDDDLFAGMSDRLNDAALNQILSDILPKGSERAPGVTAGGTTSSNTSGAIDLSMASSSKNALKNASVVVAAAAAAGEPSSAVATAEANRQMLKDIRLKLKMSFVTARPPSQATNERTTTDVETSGTLGKPANIDDVITSRPRSSGLRTSLITGGSESGGDAASSSSAATTATKTSTSANSAATSKAPSSSSKPPSTEPHVPPLTIRLLRGAGNVLPSIAPSPTTSGPPSRRGGVNFQPQRAIKPIPWSSVPDDDDDEDNADTEDDDDDSQTSSRRSARRHRRRVRDETDAVIDSLSTTRSSRVAMELTVPKLKIVGLGGPAAADKSAAHATTTSGAKTSSSVGRTTTSGSSAVGTSSSSSTSERSNIKRMPQRMTPVNRRRRNLSPSNDDDARSDDDQFDALNDMLDDHGEDDGKVLQPAFPKLPVKAVRPLPQQNDDDDDDDDATQQAADDGRNKHTSRSRASAVNDGNDSNTRKQTSSKASGRGSVPQSRRTAPEEATKSKRRTPSLSDDDDDEDDADDDGPAFQRISYSAKHGVYDADLVATSSSEDSDSSSSSASSDSSIDAASGAKSTKKLDVDRDSDADFDVRAGEKSARDCWHKKPRSRQQSGKVAASSSKNTAAKVRGSASGTTGDAGTSKTINTGRRRVVIAESDVDSDDETDAIAAAVAKPKRRNGASSSRRQRATANSDDDGEEVVRVKKRIPSKSQSRSIGTVVSSGRSSKQRKQKSRRTSDTMPSEEELALDSDDAEIAQQKTKNGSDSGDDSDEMERRARRIRKNKKRNVEHAAIAKVNKYREYKEKHKKKLETGERVDDVPVDSAPPSVNINDEDDDDNVDDNDDSMADFIDDAADDQDESFESADE